MKKLLIILSLVVLMQSNKSQAQITLQFTIDSVAVFQFYCIDLGNNDFKYVLVDSNINGFHLYNMDMTPYMTVSIPIAYGKIISEYYPIYISKTLFDCDSTNIEYAYEAPISGLFHPFYVFRTDGTILLQVDSANGPYLFGAYGGSIDVRPIINTSDGAKMFLQYYNAKYGSGLKIYSLCGTLEENVYDFSNHNSFVNIFPNPTAATLNFEIVPPNNQEQFELIIFDSNAKEQRRENITLMNNKYSMDVSSFSSGTYLFSLTSKNKVYQTGKFILTK